MAARKEQPRSVQALLTGAGVAAVVLLLELFGAFHLLVLKTRDMRMRWTKPAKGDPAQFDHPEIGIVAITDESLKWMEDESKKSWPWPREVFGFMFRACAMGQARAILFDLFTHLDKDQFATEGNWAEDIRKGPPSFLATPFSNRSIDAAENRKDVEALRKKHVSGGDADGGTRVPAPYAPHERPQPATGESGT